MNHGGPVEDGPDAEAVEEEAGDGEQKVGHELSDLEKQKGVIPSNVILPPFPRLLSLIDRPASL